MQITLNSFLVAKYIKNVKYKMLISLVYVYTTT